MFTDADIVEYIDVDINAIDNHLHSMFLKECAKATAEDSTVRPHSQYQVLSNGFLRLIATNSRNKIVVSAFVPPELWGEEYQRNQLNALKALKQVVLTDPSYQRYIESKA